MDISTKRFGDFFVAGLAAVFVILAVISAVVIAWVALAG